MTRTIPELTEWQMRDNPVPVGTVLFTKLQISADSMGTLSNSVAQS